MSRHLEKIISETEEAIIRASDKFKHAVDDGMPGKRAYAYHANLLYQDYITMTTDKITDVHGLHDLIHEEHGPTVEYLDFITVGDFLQLVDCVGEITAMANLTGDIRFSVLNLTSLLQAVRMANQNLKHFLTKCDVEELKTHENAATLNNCIMHPAVNDVSGTVVRFMQDIFIEMAECESIDCRRNLERLASACSRYLYQIGFSFTSNEWDDSAIGMKKSMDIRDWTKWGSPHCGRLFSRPIYLTWYNPLDETVYEFRVLQSED